MNAELRQESKYNKVLITGLLFLTAASLNVLLTLKLGDAHIGIRTGATDFLLPLLGIMFLSVVLAKRKLPELNLQYGWTLLSVMSIWMLVSLITGYFHTDELMTWALVNKFIGWLVLMTYFIAGVYIGLQSDKTKIYFYRGLFITLWIVCVFELLSHWFYSHGFFYEFKYIARHYRMEGFYQNPNAFGIFLAAAFVIQIYALKHTRIFPRFLVIIGSSFTLLCIFYSYSRSAWAGLILGFLIIAIIDRKLIAKVLLCSLIAFAVNHLGFSEQMKESNVKAIEYIHPFAQKLITYLDRTGKGITGATSQVLKSKNITLKNKNEKRKKIKRKKTVKKLSVKRLTAVGRIKSDGLTVRLEILKRSLSYWRESPITGIGLGVHLWNSKKEGVPDDALTIHNSINWLLVETGIIGLLIFISIIALAIKALYQSSESDSDVLDQRAMLVIIFLFMGASLATEVIYQRYFWLLLGLFLVKTNMHTKDTILEE